MNHTANHTPGYYKQLDPAESALQQLAQQVIEQERARLPDLSHVTIVLGNLYAFTQLRRALLAAAQPCGCNALLGPHIHTLQSWATEHVTLTRPIISRQAQELLLVEALQDHPELYGKASPWSLASSLLELFTELSHAATSLPDSLASFQAQIEHAYGDSPNAFAALSREANLVYSLWRAMAEQVNALGMEDGVVAYARMLGVTLESRDTSQPLYVLPPLSANQAEQNFIQRLQQQHNSCIFSFKSDHSSGQDRPDHHSDSPYLKFIRTALEDRTPDLRQRAALFAHQYPDSPVHNRLSIFLAEGAEQEAEAVELQVRRWLLEGKQTIGIITEDRRLARRVRALLERAKVFPADAGGWALSTTSAATVLERWLQCLEEDFHHPVLLDVLKSSFVFPEQDRAALLATVYRFEQGIIRGENIANNLKRYALAVTSRCQRLPAEQRIYYDEIPALLEKISAAAQPLLALVNTTSKQPGEYLHAMQKSISLLGLDLGFAQDAAGQRIRELFGELFTACQNTQLTMDWAGFRTWLGRALEVTTFHPTGGEQTVQILNLRQSHLLEFDALIVAAMEQDIFPAVHNTSPFFNDGVRANLGLATREQRQQEAYSFFFRLLANGAHHIAPCLLTARRIDAGEDIQASAWLQGLRVFHQQAYAQDLLDTSLTQLLSCSASKVQAEDPSVPTASIRPRPNLNPALLPNSLSAGAYQSLLDCPYQFYASRCLQLIPSEEVRTALSKADYGERVHLCLQAFHSPTAPLPDPFPEPVTEANRDRAETLMHAIAEKVFSEDIEDNVMHRGWLLQWKSCIPAYLQWQLERGREWSVKQTELKVSKHLPEDIHINGRLDRVDQRDTNLAVVDYKTGSTAAVKDIENGESVQLPFYALLLADHVTHVNRVEYLCFDKHTAKSKAVLQGEALSDLSQAIGTRLVEVIEALRDGAAVPAWGDELSCSRCVMQGICRRQAWQ